MAGSHNLFGAIIFFSYIAAALTVTGTIVYDLWSLHSSRPWTARRAKHGRSRLRMQSSIVMTLLSFSTLSYHMLCFLIDSYLKWSIQTKTAAPSSIQGDGSLLGVSGKRTETQIWRWATSSTLFQDFAEAIVDNPKAYFWTEKALLYSFVWNCYMAEKGEQAGSQTKLSAHTCRLTSPSPKTMGVLRDQPDLTVVFLPKSLSSGMPTTARRRAYVRSEEQASADVQTGCSGRHHGLSTMSALCS